MPHELIRTEENMLSGAQHAMQLFRDERLIEPLEVYLDFYERYRAAVENLIEGTVDLSELYEQAVEYLAQPDTLMAVRFLASPFISHDDLKVLADASLAAGKLRQDPDMARRVIDAVMTALDRQRFPWVAENREPTEAEREAAIVSTTALIATSRAQTLRRTTSKDDQERAVKDRLLSEGFTEVPAHDIPNYSHAPNPGEFCGESMFGSRRADVIVRLWDGRIMPIECKVSNSYTNSIKRVNNDAAVKAVVWRQEFGANNVVPAAMLSGVYKVAKLMEAQSQGLTIFWAHALDEFVEFIDFTMP